jgi:hypothetical protein
VTDNEKELEELATKLRKQIADTESLLKVGKQQLAEVEKHLAKVKKPKASRQP